MKDKAELEARQIKVNSMANQGVRGFYQITETIKDQLLNDVNVNTVTTGDITDIDLSKQTIFPSYAISL